MDTPGPGPQPQASGVTQTEPSVVSQPDPSQIYPTIPPTAPAGNGMIFGASDNQASPSPAPALDQKLTDQPVAVVQVLSTRGVEYTMMTLALWFAAVSIIGLLLSVINGDNSYDTLSLPVSVLVVSVPVFGFLYLRLRKDELANPELRLDPSKRRLSQFTQIFAFAACFFNVIALVYLVMQKMAGHFSGSIGKVLIDVLVVFAVAGGILAYYWIDEHRLIRQK